MRLWFKIGILLFALCQSGQAQGFFNLGFESAVIKTNGITTYDVSASYALPDWTAYISGVPQTNIIYNTVPLSDPEVTLQGNNSAYPSVQGKYFVMLWGEFNPDIGPFFYTNSAAIGQTGQVPLSAESLLFWGTMGGMQITFDGQLLNFVAVGNTNSYTIYAANISSFAGQTGQLLFTDPYYGNTYGGPGTIDNIQFSSSPVPEPGILAFYSLGCLFIAWRYRQKCSAT